MLLVTGQAAYAGSVLYVDDDATPGGDGQSWETAYRFLQDALANADGFKEIHVAQGTYRPDRNEANPQGSGDREARFHLVNDVALQGGYAGIGADDPDARDIHLYETLLSGDLLGDDGDDFADNDENSYHVVNGGNNAAVLSGFTITAGNANGGQLPYIGGGMWAGNHTTIDCIFIGNTAGAGGGYGAQTQYNHVTFLRCNFIENQATARGGGVFLDFSGNTATLIDCKFIRNTAGDLGGGACCYLDAALTLINCDFIGNSAGLAGGGCCNVFSTASMNLINCRFVGNTAVLNRGGIGLDIGPLQVIGCTFHANTAAGGNAIAFFKWVASPLYPKSETVLENAYITIANCIFRDGGDEFSFPCEDNYSITYCNVQNGWEGEGNIDADPLFADPLGPDGLPGTIDDDLRLQGGSPCIDAADNTAVPKDIDTDLDGNPRFVDDPDTKDTGFGIPPIVDMGAYEFQVKSSCPWDLDGSGSVGTGDLLELFAQWGTDGPADFDGNGVVNTADLLILFANWGPCP